MIYKPTNIYEVKLANRHAGQNFFDPDTVRFFDSRVCTELYNGRYFVTSEKPPFDLRGYTIREFLPDGTIQTIGTFLRYHTCQDARRAIQTLLRKEVKAHDNI